MYLCLSLPAYRLTTILVQVIILIKIASQGTSLPFSLFPWSFCYNLNVSVTLKKKKKRQSHIGLLFKPSTAHQFSLFIMAGRHGIGSPPRFSKQFSITYPFLCKFQSHWFSLTSQTSQGLSNVRGFVLCQIILNCNALCKMILIYIRSIRIAECILKVLDRWKLYLHGITQGAFEGVINDSTNLPNF